MSQLVISAAVAGATFVATGGNIAAAAFAFGATSALLGYASAKQRPDGPRIGDAQVTTANYGEPLPYVIATARVAGAVEWQSAKRTTTTESGGKGGGRGSSTTTYAQDVLYGLTSNPKNSLLRIWENGKLIWSLLGDQETIAASQNTPRWSRITFYGGAETQLPDPTFEAAVGVANAPAYRGRATVFIENLELGGGGQVPNLTFELSDATVTVTAGGDPVVPNVSQAPFSTVHYVTGTPISASAISSFVSNGSTLVGATVTVCTASACESVLMTSAGPTAAWAISPRWRLTMSGDTFSSAWIFENYDPDDVNSPFHPAISISINLGSARSVFDVSTPPKSLNSGLGKVWSFAAADFLDTDYIVQYSNKCDIGGSGNNDMYGALAIRFAPALSMSGALLFLADTDQLAANVNFDSFLVNVSFVDKTLRETVEELSSRAGMSADTYDASALATITKPVRSMVIAQIGATRAPLEQLMAAFYFKAAASDKVYFAPIPTAPVVTIDADEIGCGVDSPQAEALPLVFGSELEIPPQVSVRYINTFDDYQSGTETSDRLLRGQKALQTVDLAVGMTPTEAKAVADAALIDAIAGLMTGSVSLDMRHARLEPGDVVNIEREDASLLRFRLGRRSDAQGVLSFELRGDDAGALVSAGITDPGVAPPGTVRLDSGTLLLPLDIPLLRDADDRAGWYAAAKSNGTQWPGCQVFSSTNDVSFTSVATIAEEAVFGVTTTTLPNFTGAGMDQVSSVTVNVGRGLLSSSTRDAVIADRAVNTLLLGDEVMQFVTATLNSSAPNIYALSGFIRGQAGTEWAMGTHITGERAALLRPAGMRRVTTQQADVGGARFVKAITAGKPLDSVTAASFTNTGRSQRPLAPVDVRAAPSISGDLVISWKRRTRLSSPLFGAVPIGEASLAFEVEVVVASVVVRTIFVAALSATYTRAQQQTNGVSIDTAVTLRVYQMSGVVGRGYVATLTGVTGASPALLPQITTVTYGGTFQTGSIARVSLGGGTFSYVTQASDTNLAGVATAVAALIDASPDYVSSSAGAVVTVTGVASTSFPAFAGFTAGDNFGRGAIVQTAAAQSAGAAYFAYHFVTNVVTGVSDPVPSGTTLRIDYYRPIGTFVGSISYTTPAAEAALTALGGLQAAMTANATLRALGYGFGITSLSGSSVGYSVGPFGSAGVYTEGGANNQFSIASSVVNPGSAAIPADRPQIITLEVVGAPVVGWVYIVTLDDVPFSYTAVVADTTTSIAAGLAAIIDPSANFIATSLTNVLTITRATANVAFANGYDIISSTITATVAITQAAS